MRYQMCHMAHLFHLILLREKKKKKKIVNSTVNKSGRKKFQRKTNSQVTIQTQGKATTATKC